MTIKMFSGSTNVRFMTSSTTSSTKYYIGFLYLSLVKIRVVILALGLSLIKIRVEILVLGLSLIKIRVKV